jgi:putative ABC transport system permease protein
VINPLPVVRAELRRTRAATIAAVALVAVAVALGVAVTAQERALRAGTARAADAFDVLIGARGSPTQLVLSTVYLQPTALDLLTGPILARLDAEPGVAWAAPIALGDSYRSWPTSGRPTSWRPMAGLRHSPVAASSGRPGRR